MINSVFAFLQSSFSSSLVPVEGFAGDSAVLSSSIPEHEIQNKTKEFNVPVRDDKGKIVLDINGNDLKF